MKHLKILSFLLFFVLLFFQQQMRHGASAQNFGNTGNLSVNQSPQYNTLPSTVVVYMLKLDDNGKSLGVLCYEGDLNFGCAEYGSGDPYPPDSPYVTPKNPETPGNPLVIDVENYYLKNILPHEMDVATYDPPLAALKAQALASRSVADWKAVERSPDSFKSITNSYGISVFIPSSYDYYYDHNDLEKADRIKDRIDQAIRETPGEYLFYADATQKLSLDAEFSNDIGNPTTGEDPPVGEAKDYLKSVQEPIASGCDLYPVGNGWGMSQKGAMRWAKGNQCAGSGDQPWPVTWTDYRQILVHYYTGIDILNGSGGKVAPDDRWNLLWHSVPVVDGTNYSIDVKFQNTSTQDWAANDIFIGYQWTARGLPATGHWTDLYYLPDLTAKGNTTPQYHLSIPIELGEM